MKKLSEIIFLLSEQNIYQKVNLPIHNGINSFYSKIFNDFKTSSFEELFSIFLLELRKKQIIDSINYTTNLDNSILIYFFEKYYTGITLGGYAGALNDFTAEGRRGFKMILAQISDNLIHENRIKYVNWIYDTHIDLLVWDTKYFLVQDLINIYKGYLPISIKHFTQEQLILQLRELVESIISAKTIFNKTLQTKLINK